MWRVQSVLKSIARDQAQEDISCLHEILYQASLVVNHGATLLLLGMLEQNKSLQVLG